MDQPDKVANPARGQLNRENKYPLSPFAPENLVSRNGFGRPVLLTGFLPISAVASIYCTAIRHRVSPSGQAIAYRWRSLPRVRQHRASKPQGSSKRVLPWQVTMDQSICNSLPHSLLVRSEHVENTGVWYTFVKREYNSKLRY